MISTESLPAGPAGDGNRTAYRSFLVAFVGASALLLAAIAATNVVMDPYGAWQTSLFPGGYHGAASRIGKGELLHRYSGSTVFIGNSRTRIGVRPDAPGISSSRACNLGLSAAGYRELWPALDRAIEQPTVREIVLFIDYQIFRENGGVFDDFVLSRFNGDRSPLDRHCDLLFNGRTLGHSGFKLISILKGAPPEFTPDGFSIPERLAARAGFQRDRATKLLQHTFGVATRTGASRYAPEAVEMLRPLIRRCRDKSIRLAVAINPTHATLYEGIWQMNQWEDYKRWLRDLTQLIDEESHGMESSRLITLWDFAGFHPFTTEPFFSADVKADSEWFWEPSHFKCGLGDRMLERIYGLSSADPTFGVRLASATIDAHLEKVVADRHHWLVSHAADAQCVEDLVRSAQGRPGIRLANGGVSDSDRQ